jgi:hypothetical protein
MADEADDDRVDARARYLRTLIDHIREDEYPSIAHMDLVEATLPPELYAPYVDVLLDKVEGERYPSLTMLRRIERLVAGMPLYEAG